MNFHKKKIDKSNWTYWGYIHPTSCISIRKSFIKKVFDSTINENFPNIWLDLRILLYAKYIHTYETFNENLTNFSLVAWTDIYDWLEVGVSERYPSTPDLSIAKELSPHNR